MLLGLQASQLWRDNEALIEELARQGEAEGAKLALKGTFATRRGTQFVALARKYRLSYWRSPSYNLTRMIMTLLICLFYGTMFYGRGRLPTTGEINPVSIPNSNSNSKQICTRNSGSCCMLWRCLPSGGEIAPDPRIKIKFRFISKPHQQTTHLLSCVAWLYRWINLRNVGIVLNQISLMLVSFVPADQVNSGPSAPL